MILDANVLIAALDAADALHIPAVEIIASREAPRLRIPEVTLAEALVAHVRRGQEERALAYLDQLGIETVGVLGGAVELARTRVTTGLRMPDCIVLLAAEQAGEALATFDRALAAAALGRGVRVHGMSRPPKS